MSRTVALVALILTALGLRAQEPAIVDSITCWGNIGISQPQALAALLCAPARDNAATESETIESTTHASGRTGYRVQVFDDNNPRTARSQAEARHAQVMAQFPHLRAYVTFNSPYWRVKVGDFRTRAEAEAVMAELKLAFPGMAAYMRIVRDKINTVD